MATTIIKPYTVGFPQAGPDDLNRRLQQTRWPEVPGSGWSRSVPLGYLMNLAGYRGNVYGRRMQEAHLNELPHFTSHIDGQHIHFTHARTSAPSALPPILPHCWPSSFLEFTRLVLLRLTPTGEQ